MATIYRSEVTQGLANNAGIQTSKEQVPNQIADKIVPTFETNPLLLRRITIVKDFVATALSTNIYTTPSVSSNQDFYLVAIQETSIQDVANANTSNSIRATIDGANVAIFRQAMIAATVQNVGQSIAFPNPIKIDRGTNITAAIADVTAGTTKFYGTIYGYIVNN